MNPEEVEGEVEITAVSTCDAGWAEKEKTGALLVAAEGTNWLE